MSRPLVSSELSNFKQIQLIYDANPVWSNGETYFFASILGCLRLLNQRIR